ncbi:hypothetical protein RFN57_37795 [Streptomyces violaceochromogenes]|uniref:Uncharacterized protein n=1 Tax=Streptomyces violaceochromogenes TaxID=67377 RepID=A0ABU6M894_9ACTN|nr:hypothetical protein [Streptomyces violaceochromogenes]MEC7058000.1 hypothetical protein [Streptomyces violaceochromogenes]GHC50616.1 hypothetical protein GCM10010309_07050 [Streptomyces violaceochromogenes]
MTRSGGAPRRVMRLLVLLVLAGAAWLVIAWAGLPEWTMGVAVVLLLMLDDVLRRWAKKRSQVSASTAESALTRVRLPLGHPQLPAAHRAFKLCTHHDPRTFPGFTS